VLRVPELRFEFELALGTARFVDPDALSDLTLHAAQFGLDLRADAVPLFLAKAPTGGHWIGHRNLSTALLTLPRTPVDGWRTFAVSVGSPDIDFLPASDLALVVALRGVMRT
jgi:hypothetical protein